MLKSVSAQNYINFFTSASARQGIDGFLTVNYGDYADPAALLATLDLPGGDAELRQLQRPEADLAAGAGAQHGQPGPAGRADGRRPRRSTAQLLPWIPDVQPTNLLMLSKNLTGAAASFSYMFAPWANSLGGKG